MDSSEDQTRIELLESVVVNLELLVFTGNEVAQEDGLVLAPHKVMDNHLAFFFLQIYSDALFVSIDGNEIRRVRALERRSPLPRLVPNKRLLNLNDLSSHVSEH